MNVPKNCAIHCTLYFVKYARWILIWTNSALITVVFYSPSLLCCDSNSLFFFFFVRSKLLFNRHLLSEFIEKEEKETKCQHACVFVIDFLLPFQGSVLFSIPLRCIFVKHLIDWLVICLRLCANFYFIYRLNHCAVTDFVAIYYACQWRTHSVHIFLSLGVCLPLFRGTQMMLDCCYNFHSHSNFSCVCLSVSNFPLLFLFGVFFCRRRRRSLNCVCVS